MHLSGGVPDSALPPEMVCAFRDGSIHARECHKLRCLSTLFFCMAAAAGKVYIRLGVTLCVSHCGVIDNDEAILLFRLILRHPAGSHGNRRRSCTLQWRIVPAHTERKAHPP